MGFALCLSPKAEGPKELSLRAARPKVKTFEKGQIVVQCHISGTKGPRKVFKLNETSLRSKESFDETDEAVSARFGH